MAQSETREMTLSRAIAELVRDAVLEERERCIKIAQGFGTKAMTRDIVTAITRNSPTSNLPALGALT